MNLELKRVYTKIFMWMFIGLFVTFLTGYIVSSNENMLINIFGKSTWIFLAIAEVVLVIILSARIRKMNALTAKIMFIVYSFVSGLTFSSIFVVYELESIMYVFGITSILFGLFALIGHFTKIDLSKLGTILFMGLIGLVICGILGIFIQNETFNITVCIIGIIIFTLYVMFDMHKIKYLFDSFDDEDNLAICCALELYLDFINIFIELLRLLGESRD